MLSDTSKKNAETGNSPWQTFGTLLAALWLLGGAVAFFIRFTAAFHHEHHTAIDHLLESFIGGISPLY